MSALDVPGHGLVLPGQGFVPLHVLQAQRAVKEYADDLQLGQHPQTGDWVILKNGPTGPFPIFGLGHELPAPEAIKKKLYEGDVVRNGARIIEQIERRYDAERRAAKADRDASTEVAAEALLWAARKDGKANIPRVFIPGKG